MTTRRPVSRRALVVLTAHTETRIVWNWPVFAFWRGCWRYGPGEHEDGRRSFSRTRVGWLKVEVVRW